MSPIALVAADGGALWLVDPAAGGVTVTPARRRSTAARVRDA